LTKQVIDRFTLGGTALRWSKFDYKARMKSALERHIESVHEKQFNYSLCDFKTVNDHEGIKPL